MLELSPTDDYAHYALGRALEKQGREAEANGHYKLASSMDPASAQLRRPHPRARLAPRARGRPAGRARARVDARAARSAPGLCVLLGVAASDDEAAAERLAGKVARLRIFEGDDGKFDRSLLDTGGAALVVSQFTLIADTAQGNRPSFSEAARPEQAEPLYERFCAALRDARRRRSRPGVFGARMEVELVNDGPVTIVLDSSTRPGRVAALAVSK